MHEALNQDDFLVFVVTLCALWGARRKVMYEGIFQTPFAINDFIHSYIGELKALQVSDASGIRAPQRRPSHWIAPPARLVKLNADATMGQSHGVVGAVCRD